MRVSTEFAKVRTTEVASPPAIEVAMPSEALQTPGMPAAPAELSPEAIARQQEANATEALAQAQERVRQAEVAWRAGRTASRSVFDPKYVGVCKELGEAQQAAMEATQRLATASLARLSLEPRQVLGSVAEGR